MRNISIDGIELDFIVTDFEIDIGGKGGKCCLMGADPKSGKLKTIVAYYPYSIKEFKDLLVRSNYKLADRIEEAYGKKIGRKAFIDAYQFEQDLKHGKIDYSWESRREGYIKSVR